ncbi:MobP3 family relaxase [Anaerotruncus massiliensis (ex Togo et al. 2019)]|uniref:MobP3 family relaxase n=2 Tax=Oscillospiraceae TaxID=216572 RepID=UPI000C77AE5C|nr:MobP3 family relaxase [Anaerotruncus massiliensis (ex Togo et al. 2019)]
MAKLIVKSPYIKCTGGGNAAGAGGYLHYIGTREHVQKLTDDRPPTRKQEQLIAKLMKDFPGVKQLEEYGGYEERKTKVTASALITMALEENWQAVSQMDGYVNYIATRPRAERLGAHGLFGDEDGINLKEAMAELNSYTGNVWTHIISLHREDAARLGYDSAQAWRNLIRAHRNDIAAAMKIPPKDFHWYAAFHDEGEHPHIHMMAWSAKPGQAYLSREGIQQIKSVLMNDIFKQELLHVYEQKSASRDELVREARREILELVCTMQTGLCDHPEVETLILQLAQGLETVRGKKSYGYLPKPLKALTDQIVDQMERIPAVAQCYEKWLTLQGQVDSYYGGDERKRLKLSQQKEFRAIKNAVIQEAERIRAGEITFEDENLSAADELESTRYNVEFYCQYRDKIYDADLPLDERDYAAEQMARAAQAGNPYAQHLLGKLYRDGTVVIPDAEKAQDWFQRSAEQGLNVARYALGKLLLTDDPLVRNIPTGLCWLELAQQNGRSYAGYRLGKEYLRGKIVPRDVPKALEYLNDAAQRGNQFAQYTLGKLYLLGREVPQDKALAEQWLKQSAAQGNEYAQFFLDRLDQFRPPSVLLAATHLLRQIGSIFQDNSLPKSSPGGIRYVDRKLRQREREKKIAMGHRADDHEEYTGPTMSM